MPCTPPRTEEDIYNSLDADFFQKKKEESTIQNHPLLKEILFKEVQPRNNGNIGITFNYSSESSSPETVDYREANLSPLRDLLFKQSPKNQTDDDKDALKVHIEDSREKITIDDDKSLDKDEDLYKFKDAQKADHQLLREVLRDTSFQRKYNLRPVDLGGVGTGFVEEMETGDQCVADLPREQIEPVLSLAIQQLQKDFDNTCVALGIHPGKSYVVLFPFPRPRGSFTPARPSPATLPRGNASSFDEKISSIRPVASFDLQNPAVGARPTSRLGYNGRDDNCNYLRFPLKVSTSTE